MRIIRFILVGFCLLIISKADGQNTYDDFGKYLTGHIQLSDSLKYDCTWHYAIVRMKTGKAGKVVKIDFLNPVHPNFAAIFNFLREYKFDAKYKINGRSVIFYFSYDNFRVCKYESQSLKVSQNDVAGQVWYYLGKARKESPDAIVLPSIIMTEYFPTER